MRARGNRITILSTKFLEPRQTAFSPDEDASPTSTQTRRASEASKLVLRVSDGLFGLVCVPFGMACVYGRRGHQGASGRGDEPQCAALWRRLLGYSHAETWAVRGLSPKAIEESLEALRLYALNAILRAERLRKERGKPTEKEVKKWMKKFWGWSREGLVTTNCGSSRPRRARRRVCAVY